MSFSTSILQCPDCSKVLQFASRETSLLVCASCGTIVVRNDSGVTRKPSFPILEKNDIIQPGTTGKWNEKSFRVLGRFRGWFEESVFNYWTILFETGELAILAEGYGIYQVLVTNSLTFPDQDRFAHVNAGGKIELLPKLKYVVRRRLKCHKWEIEGEVNMPREATSPIVVLECSHTDGTELHVFQWARDEFTVYRVDTLSFADLQLDNLRTHEYSKKSFTCEKCSATIAVKTYPYAQSCGCTNCGTSYTLTDGFNFKKEGTLSTIDVIYLPLGSKGVVNNTEYEVIGFTIKEELNIYRSKWREHILYNAKEGYAFLSEFDGHWIYLRETPSTPVNSNLGKNTLQHDGIEYDLYNQYSAKVIDARGEFPHDIFDNEAAVAREFISPPKIWIQEKHPDEGIVWYKGQHVAASAVRRAFSVDYMPYQKGIGAVQPGGVLSGTTLLKAFLAAAAFLLVVHFSVMTTKKEEVLFDKTFFFNGPADDLDTILGRYTFDKRASIVEFEIAAPVDNSWLEIDASFVDVNTGKEYSMQQGVEYYYGYSEGERWSEGDRRESGYIKKIPAGTYQLQLRATRENVALISQKTPLTTFNLKTIYDVPSHRNLWWTFPLLLIWPATVYLQSRIKEGMRWSNSPFGEDEQ